MNKTNKLSVFYKIKLWWKFKAQFFHTDFIRGVKNIFKWLPIVWKDRDWDDSYIFNVLTFKLKNTAKYIGERDWHENAKRDSERMMTCVRLIEKVQEDYYSMEWLDYDNSDYDFVDFPGSNLKELKVTRISENFDDYFAKHKSSYKKIMSGKEAIFGNDEKQKTAMNIGRYKHNQARRLLFEIMERHIEGWWS
jgi:hypothetical protein